jgi:hypothetical protein
MRIPGLPGDFAFGVVLDGHGWRAKRVLTGVKGGQPPPVVTRGPSSSRRSVKLHRPWRFRRGSRSRSSRPYTLLTWTAIQPRLGRRGVPDRRLAAYAAIPMSNRICRVITIPSSRAAMMGRCGSARCACRRSGHGHRISRSMSHHAPHAGDSTGAGRTRSVSFRPCCLNGRRPCSGSYSQSPRSLQAAARSSPCRRHSCTVC